MTACVGEKLKRAGRALRPSISAFEGGKKLFFKCPEVYDALVKYHGLPDGVQKLKRL